MNESRESRGVEGLEKREEDTEKCHPRFDVWPLSLSWAVTPRGCTFPDLAKPE